MSGPIPLIYNEEVIILFLQIEGTQITRGLHENVVSIAVEGHILRDMKILLARMETAMASKWKF